MTPKHGLKYNRPWPEAGRLAILACAGSQAREMAQLLQSPKRLSMEKSMEMSFLLNAAKGDPSAGPEPDADNLK